MPATAMNMTPTPVEFERVNQAISIGGLAKKLGVPRQRIYGMVHKGRIKGRQVSGNWVISADEANRVLDAAVRVSTPKRNNRVVFDFV